MNLPRLAASAAPWDLERIASREQITLLCIVSLRLGAGLAAWYHHRETDTETTPGTHAAAIHVLLLAEAGMAVRPSLFRHIHASVLLAAIGALASTVPSSANVGPQGP